MLRRRRRTPKDRPAIPSVAAPLETTRRRPRPGVQVPSRPLLAEQPLVTEQKPKAATARQAVVLVTGFDAFGGETDNPSWQICERLPRELAGLRIETCRVPCEFRRAIEVVGKAIDRLHPRLVVCLGQAGGRSHLSVERVAINVDDARIADNAERRPIDEPVVAGGPAAYFSTLPIKAMVEAMRAANVPAQVSNSAGTYVCNHLMYGVLHHVAKTGVRAGFIHVPYAEAQVLDKPGIAALSIETMVRGIEAAIVAADRHSTDLRIGGGSLD